MDTLSAVTSDDSRVRALFNALRTGDHGVSCDRFLGAFYWLQHRTFSVFDARDAFVSSSATSERFLSYREFQYALLKTARAVAVDNTSDTELLTQLLDKVQTTHQSPDEHPRPLDSIQRQLTQSSVFAVLDQHMRQLIQSFQVYGQANELTPRHTKQLHDTTIPMTLDGFVDFLNAYFEYEDYFSYQTIQQLAELVVEAFGITEKSPLILYFPHFIELFCRVASHFHVITLEREGARLRKAVESSHLEFSLQLLFEKMDIHLLQDHEKDTPNQKQDRLRAVVLPQYDLGDAAVDALTLDDDPDKTDPATTSLPSIASLLDELSVLLGVDVSNSDAPLHESSSQSQSQPQKPRSRLFARLPPRKTALSPRPVWLPSLPEDPPTPWNPPSVTLIREVVSPPPLPPNILKRLEHVIFYQNTGQFHMARGALHQCRALYQKSHSLADETETRVFFSLMAASIDDSARNDQRALAMYIDALRAAERLQRHHPGRTLVLNCVGCMLFYMGEFSFAKRCHTHVLEIRRQSLGDSHVDTATAMNNLACCLSQDPQGSTIEEAYLYLKTAKRIYKERFGSAHARVELVGRNFEHVLSSQRMVVVDPIGAITRGEYTHVIPGSRFQIKALVQVQKDKIVGTKKKKKGGKSGKKKK